MKYLSIDYGDKKVGLAIGDDEVKIASPFSVLENDNKLMINLTSIIETENIESVVIGLPLGLAGQQSAQYKKVRRFITKLVDEINIPIIEEDEKLTSAYAQKLGSGKIDDDVAAMIILQSYFDKITN
jgi:putative Holliday junction resolvase